MGKKRRRKRRCRLSRVYPYIVTMGLATGYIVKSLGGEILEFYNYSSLQDEVVSEPSTEEFETEEELESEKKEEASTVESEEQETTEEVLEEEPKVEVISDELLNLGYDFKSIDFEELKDKNEAICGWITIDGTNINYPIVNATDENNDYYAHHDLDGNYSNSGTIYVDNRCNSLENPTYDLSDVTLVYGHHMKYGKMFANLCNYMNDKFIDDHQFGVIYTPDGYAYKVTFFAGSRYSGESDAPMYRKSLEDEEAFYDYIDSLKEVSSFVSDVEVNYGDKIIGLVTCEYSAGIDSNYRYCLFGILEKQYVNELQKEDSIDDNDVKVYALK